MKNEQIRRNFYLELFKILHRRYQNSVQCRENVCLPFRTCDLVLKKSYQCYHLTKFLIKNKNKKLCIKFLIISKFSALQFIFLQFLNNLSRFDYIKTKKKCS